MDETDMKLRQLQKQLFRNFGFKVDLYREEGKGILVVPHGKYLLPRNVIFAMTDYHFLNL